MESVVLIRNKNIPYTVNYEGKRYVWAGSKGTIVSKKSVPLDVYDYLASFTSTFQNGDLVVDPKSEQAQELEDNILDKEAYTVNGMSKDEVIELLKGNFKKMECELNKVTSDSTKRFVMSVAKEIKIANSTKQKFLKDWVGNTLSIEDIFDIE